ncbi:alpha/beta fold hydrolase [Pontibacter ramchanderi]|uniref:Pimeloyl-ACP methyl ester carboxylesterase n=1 Tax=Pontibacter ramchanderi TaxID=1179743 RepID=A0A2N3U939_9BACT|nr:alpha/beta hydrolase [Pontibacter ramchanderi]PKV63279.1 pimeloyl-ACP methyl ester carboxylesterase [Pontibacter ramchanderi]
MRVKPKSIAIAAALALLVAFAFMIRADIPAEELKARYTTFSSRFVNIAGVELHYRDEGQGMPIILLHGTAASLQTWDGWSAELSKQHRVLRLDLPGFGLTGPNPSGSYSIDYYRDLLLQFMDSLGIEQAHIGGSSLGGQIAYEFAATYPKRVQKLILVSPTGVTNANDKNITLPFRMAQTPLLRHSLKYVTPRFIVAQSLREVYGDDTKLKSETISLSHDLLLREGNRNAFIDRLNTVDSDNLHKLAQVQAPTLILWGEADAWVSPTDARRFQQGIRGAQLKLYAGAGHIPMEEQPQETLKDVLSFLSQGVALRD